ncbi:MULTISPECIES: serine hydrolase domain-containing protein [Kordiimonas]|jgi:CubicO group peptidase (beta-lactamase class C family)|uniref:serine hydrolase domain-containing protein n=1 Tax=Kordiimonas TaxID=288021 RepID=UPI00257EA712|nr:serine hydrolase domain-containing protein [Kordiimonas sp. UBA4487]
MTISKLNLAATIAAILLSTGVSAQSLDYQRKMTDAVNGRTFIAGADLSRYAWLNMETLFLQDTITRQGSAGNLPSDFHQELDDFHFSTGRQTTTLYDHVMNSGLVDGIVIVQNGTVIYERYPHMKASDRHALWSVSKVALSTALGVLEQQGKLSLWAPIDRYLPELEGTDWQGITVRDIADMASGMDCREVLADAFTNPERCIFGYFAALFNQEAPKQQAPHAYDIVRAVSKRQKPGQSYTYTSVNSFVLARLVEELTDMPYADALSSLVWNRIGAEADALVLVNKHGEPDAGGGISARLRDVARLGMAYLHTGPNANILSQEWKDAIQEDARPDLMQNSPDGIALNLAAPHQAHHNARQWDKVWLDGDHYKSGFSGQGLYVSPHRDLVIAWVGTHARDGHGTSLVRAARALAASDQFPAHQH